MLDHGHSRTGSFGGSGACRGVLGEERAGAHLPINNDKAVSYGLRFFLLRFFTLGPLLGRIHRFKIRKSLESRSKIQIN